MRVRALAIRILHQMRHDRRTIALMLVAPVMLLSLLYFILGDSVPVVNVALVSAPAGFETQLEEQNITSQRMSAADARHALESGDVVASVNMADGKMTIELDGSKVSKSQIALAALEKARNGLMPTRPDLISDVRYVYGEEDIPLFDNFGPTLMGFIIFFLVFLISGISFLQERNSGTLEKLLSTPIKRWEIVTGYVLGFGAITVLQSILVSWYCVYVLQVMMVGSFFLILLITLLTAMIALTFGILISTLARNEFQMIQFIPIVIIPQMFFSGLFDLPLGARILGYIVPLHYISDALTKVMIKGSGLGDIILDLFILLASSVLFMTLNTMLLKKYRQI